MSELERLTTRLEDQEAKGLYCGGKMDTIIATLQDEIPEIPNLNPDTENTLFLAIAGLKQVHSRHLTMLAYIHSDVVVAVVVVVVVVFAAAAALQL